VSSPRSLRDVDSDSNVLSFLAQLEHLSQAVFNREDLDAGERQLGFALAFDYDLDNFAAAIGFARQTIENYLVEPGKLWRAESGCTRLC
jgi:dynactin 1